MNQKTRIRLDYELINKKIANTTQRGTGWIRGIVKKIAFALDRYDVTKKEMEDMNMRRQFHKQTVRSELKEAGLSHFDLAHPEARHLDEYLRKDEKVIAAVRGRNGEVTSILIAATNRRLLYLSLTFLKKIEHGEIPYSAVTSVSSSSVNGLWSTVDLKTYVRNFNLTFVNSKAAKRFVDFIETMTLGTQTPPQLSTLAPA